MKFHLVISLVICTCLAMAITVRSMGYEDYVARMYPHYDWYARMQEIDHEVETTEYGSSEDNHNYGGDNSKELSIDGILDMLGAIPLHGGRNRNDNNEDDYSKEYNGNDDSQQINSITDEVMFTYKEWDGNLNNDDHYSEHSREDQNDNSQKTKYQTEIEDGDHSYDNAGNTYKIHCTTDKMDIWVYRLICGSQNQRTFLNTDNIEYIENTELNSSEEGTLLHTASTEEAQYLTTTSNVNHGNLEKNLASSSSNSKLLTTEFSDNILKFQTINDETDTDLWSLMFGSEKISSDFFAMASGDQGDYEYNSHQYRQLMDDITVMLANVDKFREQILEMQKIGQRFNYHMLLNALLREIYGANQGITRK